MVSYEEEPFESDIFDCSSLPDAHLHISGLDLGDTSLTIHRFDDYCNNRQNIENNRLDFWL